MFSLNWKTEPSMLYSSDLKQKVVESYLNKEGSIRTLSRRFKVSTFAIQKWLNRYREHGDFGNNMKNSGRKSILSEEELNHLFELLKVDPNLTLADMVDYVSENYSKSISDSSLSRIFHDNGWRYKKKRWQPQRRTVKGSKS